MFPELQSERFFLKQITKEDQDFIFKGLSNPNVVRYYGVQYNSFEETKAQMDFYDDLWRKKSGCWWKIAAKQDLLPVGACGMNYFNPVHEKAEVGYWLLPEFQGKGIMVEVMPVMISHLFDNWKLHRLEAVIEEGNEASCKLCEKLGFTREGRLRESELKFGKRINLYLYSLLATDKRPGL